MICFKWHHDTGKFPSTKDINTHDLVNLKNRIISGCISINTAFSRPITKEDYEYMSNDEELNNIIIMLSLFGKFARYYNLDVVTSNMRLTVDIERMWSGFENELKEKHYDLIALSNDPARLDDYFHELNRIIVIKLERFARALTRQFTLGDLGDEAKRHCGAIGCFLHLKDDQLGNTNYKSSPIRGTA